MKRAAILNPESLLAAEVADALGRRPELWGEIRLLSADPERIGTLTEAGGAASIVLELDPEALSAVDALFVCGPDWPEADLLERLAASMPVLLVSPADPPAGSQTLVAGVNLERAEPGRVLVSPHPAVVLLAYLAAPLAALGLESLSATLLMPASDLGQAGLEELLEQGRGILAFQSDWPKEQFGDQMAFNLLPSSTPAEPLERELGALAGGARVTLQLVRAGVFHGVAASAHVELDADRDADAVVRALTAPGFVAAQAAGAPSSPVTVASRHDIVLGEVRPDAGRPGAFWLWAVMDNLTRGGALNAVAVAEALVADEAAS